MNTGNRNTVGMSFFTGAFMRLCSSATASNACRMNIVTNANASENSIEFMYVQNIAQLPIIPWYTKTYI